MILPPLVFPALRLGSSLAHKHKTRLEATDGEKHSSLLRYGINGGRKSFRTQAFGEKNQLSVTNFK